MILYNRPRIEDDRGPPLGIMKRVTVNRLCRLIEITNKAHISATKELLYSHLIFASLTFDIRLRINWHELAFELLIDIILIAGRESPFSTEWIRTTSTSIPRRYLRRRRLRGRLWRRPLPLHRPQARHTPCLKSYVNLTVHRKNLKVKDKGLILNK